MVWDDPDATDGTLQASEYNNLVDAVTSPVFVGRVTITGTGTQTVTGVGFQPSQIKFEGEAARGQGSDTAGTGGSEASNYFGSFTGFARDDGTRQVVHSGGSGNSINNSSHYSSSTECIAIRYAGQSGSSAGYLKADVTSFDADGFTLDVTNYTQNEVVIYTAYR